MAKKKIAVFAGHDHDTWETTGGKGVRTDLEKDGVYEEYDTNIIIAREVVEELRRYDEFEIYFPQEDGRKMYYTKRADYCNKHDVDFAMFIHSNAAGSNKATGACVFTYPNTHAQPWADEYIKGMKKRGFPLWQNGQYEINTKDGWSWFYVMVQSNMPVVLTENFFFTTPEELRKYLLNPTNRSKIADIHIESTLKYFGVKAKPEKKPSEDGLYKVQTFAGSKEGAEKMKKQLEKDGYSVYMFKQ